MANYHLKVEEFRYVEDLNDCLENIPGEDVVNVVIQPRLFAATVKVHDEKEEIKDASTRKKVLTESKCLEEPDKYDSKAVDAIMTYVDFFGIENCAEMLKFLRDNRICSQACLARMLDEAIKSSNK